MPRFDAPRLSFGRKAPADGVPTPKLRKAAARRHVQLAEADGILTCVPGPGESLHAVMTGRHDLMHLLVALIGRLGTEDALRCATLSFNGRNLDEMLGLLDGGAVRSMTLLCSSFFSANNKDLWGRALAEFRERGHRAAAARSHAKVVTIATQDGRRFVLEGSANLRTNSNREQFVLFQDADLAAWHDGWILELVAKHEGEEAE